MNVSRDVRRLIDSYPIPAGVKDEYSRYLYVNKHYARIVGIKRHTDVIGLTVKDLPTSSSRSVAEFNSQDLQVMQTGKYLPAYCVYRVNCDANAKVYRYIKSPYKDSNDQTKGVIFITEDFTNKIFVNIGSVLAKKCAEDIAGDVIRLNNLSKKHQNIMFYTCLGMSAKEVSTVLSISERTVESYLEQIKLKLGVLHKSRILSYPINPQIPDGILSNDISVVIDDRN